MKFKAMVLTLTVVLLPIFSDARCRTVGESASLGSEYGTFPLYPAERMVDAGQKRDSVILQWVGYGIGLPLFVVAMPFAVVGAGAGARTASVDEVHRDGRTIADGGGSVTTRGAARVSGATPSRAAR